MSERIRLNFDASDRLRRALAINAARTNRSLGDVVEWMAEQLISEDLEIADRSIAEGVSSPQPKRGRKPKGGN